MSLEHDQKSLEHDQKSLEHDQKILELNTIGKKITWMLITHELD